MLNFSSTGASSCSRPTFISFDSAFSHEIAVVDLKDGLAARLQHAAALVDQPLRVGGVLHDAVRVHQIEGVVGKRQLLAVGDLERAAQPLLREVGARQLDRRRREIDAGDVGAAFGEPREIDAGAAADFEDRRPAVAVEVDEPQQVVQLLEVILVEIVEEPARSDRMPRDLEVVDVPVPVGADVVDRRHAEKLYYRGATRS